jgi:polyhydroxybutyrate depolymerase
MKFLYIICLAILSLQLNAQTLDLNFSFDGLSRVSKLHVPSDYDEQSEFPLVVLLHGLGGTGSGILQASGLIAEASDPSHPFFILSPTATVQDLFSATEWNEGVNPLHTVDDVSYISALIDSVMINYNINPERIYCTGFSDGGFMTNRLACELNDRIAAFASVGGTRATAIDCNPDRGIPVFHIHGNADPVVGYDGNNLFGSPFLASLFISVDELINDWTNDNTCIADIAAISIGNNTEAYYYAACDDASEVWLYKVNGGDHEWDISSDFNTAEVIWEFFDQFSLSVGVEETANTYEISMYPNPASESVQINNPSSRFNYLLFDVAGRVVKSGVLKPGTTSLNVSNLNPGMYFMHLVNDQNVEITKKLQIQ